MLGEQCNFNNPIQFIFKEVVSLLDICELIAVGNQRGGVDLALLDQAQNLRAVAAVYAAGFDGQVLAVHLRQWQSLGLVVEGHHGDDGVGPGAVPGQTESVLGPGHFQHHVRAAVIGVGDGEGLAVLGLADQHFGVVFPDEGDAGRVFFADDDAAWAFQHDAEQGADSCGTRADDEDGVLRLDLADPGGPEAGGQHVAHEEGLLVGDGIGDAVHALVRVGYPDVLCLPAVDAAAQGPAAAPVGAVVDVAVLAEEALAAEGLHIHRHPVPGPDSGDGVAHGFHHAHHLVTHGDARHRPGHRAVLDVQIAGADGAESYPDNGVPGVQKDGLRLVDEGEFSVFSISQGFHGGVPPEMFEDIIAQKNAAGNET